MRSNKIDNLDLFTQAANNSFTKHIKTQSKRALEIIDQSINWNKVVKPLEAVINRSDRGRKPFPYQTLYYPDMQSGIGNIRPGEQIRAKTRCQRTKLWIKS